MHGSERHRVWHARAIRFQRRPRAASGALPLAYRPPAEAGACDAHSLNSITRRGVLTMKILLAIDGSPFSDAAVKEIATRPWPAGSEVRIISVVEPPLLPTVETWVPPDDYIEALERAGQDQGRSIVGNAANR